MCYAYFAIYFKTTSIGDIKKKFVLIDKNINDNDQKELKNKEFIKGLYEKFSSGVISRDNLPKSEQKVENKIENKPELKEKDESGSKVDNIKIDKVDSSMDIEKKFWVN